MFTRICGEIQITTVPEPRVFTPKELRLLVAKGHAKVLTRARNMVTNLGLSAVTGLLGGGYGNRELAVTAPLPPNTVYSTANVTDLAIWELRLASSAGTPTAPSGGDEALEGATVISATPTAAPILTISHPSYNEVWFSTLIANGSLPDPPQYINEDGLFNVDGFLLARATFAPVSGTSDVQFDHKIYTGVS